jgi:hypothetical protein
MGNSRLNEGAPRRRWSSSTATSGSPSVFPNAAIGRRRVTSLIPTACRRECIIISTSPRSPDSAGVFISFLRTALKGCFFFLFRLQRSHHLDAVERKDQLDAHQLLDPKCTIIVESRDAFSWGDEIRSAGFAERPTNSTIARLVGVSFHDGGGSV